MRINTHSLSKRLLIIIGLCVLCILPLAAQDQASEGYHIAEERIQDAKLKNARFLDLSGLNLNQVPPEIGQLTSLREYVDLSENHLWNLPEDMKHFTNLGVLILSHNQFRRVPPEILSMTNLGWLKMEGNQLTSLPPEIAQLSNLELLNLSDNQLTILPPEIGQFAKLEWLHIRRNRLTSLPPEIGQLPRLQELWIDGNQLTSLPVELGQIHRLNELIINDNPLTMPPNIQSKGTPAILAYLRDYQAMLMRQTIAAIAAGIGGIAILILAFRARQRHTLGEKKKR